jgi:hypothetical protein
MFEFQSFECFQYWFTQSDTFPIRFHRHFGKFVFFDIHVARCFVIVFILLLRVKSARKFKRGNVAFSVTKRKLKQLSKNIF